MSLSAPDPALSPSRDRILRSALELFSSRGYDATAVREICEAAGVTKPTLYHFFGSKAGVHRALVEGALADFRDGLGRALESPGGVRERLQALARAYFEPAVARPDLSRFVVGLIHRPAGTAPATDFPRYYEDLVRLVGTAVEDGVRSGELRRGPLSTRMIVLMGTLAQAQRAYLWTGRPELTDALAAEIVDTILAGWQALPVPKGTA